MAITFNVEINDNGNDNMRLRKELGMIKHVIHEQLNEYENSASIPSSFFVGMVKTIRQMEGAFERAHVKDQSFIYFLKALLHKAKKERMVVVKPMERTFEFKKMKTAGDSHDTLRRSDSA